MFVRVAMLIAAASATRAITPAPEGSARRDFTILDVDSGASVYAAIDEAGHVTKPDIA